MKSKSPFSLRLTKHGYERLSHDDSEIPDPDESVVLLVREFIKKNCKRSSQFNKHCGSYTMKHVAETAIGRYVGNGEFIKAALDEGYSTRYCLDSLNCELRMKCKTDVYSNYYSISDRQKKQDYI